MQRDASGGNHNNKSIEIYTCMYKKNYVFLAMMNKNEKKN